MPFVRRYKDMETDLDALYKDVVKELQNEKELNIVKEMSGLVDKIPFMSVTAARVSVPKAILGTLREVTVTITGISNEYFIEMHIGEWFSNLIVPGAGATIIGGPIAGVAVAGATGLLAVNYGRKLKNRIKELVKKHSKAEYSDEKVETFIG